MSEDTRTTVFWSEFTHNQRRMYIAATIEGLSYIGTPNAPFEELKTWVEKRFSKYSLVEKEEELKPYMIELVDYLDEKRKLFSVRLDLRGTPFQQSVWEALQEIPYGQTVSYTDIAERIGKSSAVRAVGTAIGANPVLIIVPCHRVITKYGKLGGFRAGLDMKEQLLKLEK